MHPSLRIVGVGEAKKGLLGTELLDMFHVVDCLDVKENTGSPPLCCVVVAQPTLYDCSRIANNTCIVRQNACWGNCLYY